MSTPIADASPPAGRLRICLYSHQFFPMVGGLEQVAMTLATAWAAAGHDVTLATATAAPDAGYDRQFPFPVVRLSGGAAGRAAWGPILAGADVVVSNGVSLTHWPTWVRRRAAVVFVHQLYLGIPPWKLPGSFVEQWRRWARLLVRRWVVRRAAGNVFISRFMRDQVSGTDDGGKPVHGVVIYNPIDAAFRPLPDVPRSGDLAFFGRMVDEKGVAHLLAAVAECDARGHRFTLDLYGEGRDLPAFRAAAAALGLGEDRVRWHPFARGEPLVAAMNAAGVVVVPSTWWEPMGIVAVEAMACGKCVVGSAKGGLGEVLDGVCPTYPNGDTAALADRLIGVLTDPAARAACEAAAVRRAADFRPDVLAAAYVDYLRAVLAGRRG